MALEIERKYLVDVTRWTPRGTGTLYRQGYLSSHKDRVVRVRLQGDVAKLTIKGPTTGVTRTELEYDLPRADVDDLLALCEQPIIEKTRYVERYEGLAWEIDVFHGANQGLVIAEVELTSEDQQVVAPAWATREVSADPRYYNSNLISHPYSMWVKDP
jgi:adenylate cyclase